MASLYVSEWCIRTIHRIICDLKDYGDGWRMHPYVLDAQQVQLELAFHEVVAAEILHGSSHASNYY